MHEEWDNIRIRNVWGILTRRFLSINHRTELMHFLTTCLLVPKNLFLRMCSSVIHRYQAW